MARWRVLPQAAAATAAAANAAAGGITEEEAAELLDELQFMQQQLQEYQQVGCVPLACTACPRTSFFCAARACLVRAWTASSAAVAGPCPVSALIGAWPLLLLRASAEGRFCHQQGRIGRARGRGAA